MFHLALFSFLVKLKKAKFLAQNEAWGKLYQGGGNSCAHPQFYARERLFTLELLEDGTLVVALDLLL